MRILPKNKFGANLPLIIIFKIFSFACEQLVIFLDETRVFLTLRANVGLTTRKIIITFSERSARDGFTEMHHVYDSRYKTAAPCYRGALLYVRMKDIVYRCRDKL